MKNKDQLSLFDFIGEEAEAARKIEHDRHKQCYRCVAYKSHRCINRTECPDGLGYMEYTGSKVRQCIKATAVIYQDGYIHCPILHSITCEKCMENFGGEDLFIDENQNYDKIALEKTVTLPSGKKCTQIAEKIIFVKGNRDCGS